MGKFFSDEVEQALQYIYYDERAGRGKEGFELLERAAAAGDGDACCVLARCLWGPQYVWHGHGFPEDDDRASELLRKAVERGSALAVLVAMRVGELTPSMESKMPFASLQEAFDVVLEKAEAGDAFCQYAIGNTYFWWDFVRIQNKDINSFPSPEACRAYLKENIAKCEGWFLKAYQNGMHSAGNNLNNYYSNGDKDLIAPQPEKAADIIRQGAVLGYPTHQLSHGQNLHKAGNKAEAMKWFQQAAEGGELEAWFYIGLYYETGENVPQDPSYAAQCYEKGLARGMQQGCANRLGALYCEGKGVPQDYAKGFQLIKWAYDQGNTWGVFYLGTAYFYGRGVQQDYVKAREILEKVDWNNKEVFYCLGVIYGQGLGVQENIAKGVEYLQKAKDYPAAKEELLKYKKTLFGKWVRR